MPVPVTLGISFTQAEVDAMKAGAQVIIDTIMSKADVNLSNEESSLSTIAEDRLPYVLKSITEYGVSYPHLNSIAYSLANAGNDLDTYGKLFEVITKLTEATERAEEMRAVAGHFSYKFMRDQYNNADRHKGDNVVGAQVVYDGLKGCFEGQGDVTNPAPQVP